MIKINLVALILVVAAATAENVPVILWGSSPVNTYITAVKSYSENEFSNILSNYIKPETVTVVFTENHLTTENLSSCKTISGATCFQGIAQNSNKIYMPNVEQAQVAIEQRAENAAVDSVVITNDNQDFQINKDAKFIFVALDDSVAGESDVERFSRHDEIISSIAEELSAQNKNVLFVYTGKNGKKSSLRVVRQAPAAAAAPAPQNATVVDQHAAAPAATHDKVIAVAPEVLLARQEAATNATYFRRDNLLFYFKSFNAQNEHVAFTDAVVTVAEPGLKVSLKGPNELNFDVSVASGYWEIKNINYRGNSLRSNTRIGAVDGFSFACHPTIALYRNTTIELYLSSLQIQPNMTGDSNFVRFGDAWDCVGFTSAGIWGGLFVTFMMIIILSIGLSWMMEIRTMDRFDDPKGKTITTNVSE